MNRLRQIQKKEQHNTKEGTGDQPRYPPTLPPPPLRTRLHKDFLSLERKTTRVYDPSNLSHGSKYPHYNYHIEAKKWRKKRRKKKKCFTRVYYNTYNAMQQFMVVQLYFSHTLKCRNMQTIIVRGSHACAVLWKRTAMGGKDKRTASFNTCHISPNSRSNRAGVLKT